MIYREHDTIKFIVQDDGVGFDVDILSKDRDNKVKLGGYGVNNTIERLKIFYGEKADVRIESSRGVGTKISIIIPADVIISKNHTEEIDGGDQNA